MPREVICSPSHIRNMVPPISVMTVEMRKNRPGSCDDVAGALQADGDAPGLEHRQHHGQVARVLVEDLAAGLAFLLQRLERRHHRGQELDDDRGRDVGHDVEREDRHALDGAAREHVEQAEHAAGRAAGSSAAAPRGRCRAAGCRCRAGRRSSAPSVNQMRFFSSSALAIAPKLMLAASCSAADAIVRSPPRSGMQIARRAIAGRDNATRAASRRDRRPPRALRSQPPMSGRCGSRSRLRNGAEDRHRAAGLLDGRDGRLRRARAPRRRASP